MFTVVIPLYNKAHILVRTLVSVLTQTYAEFEVVIVNDGSTDNWEEAISIFSHDTRIRIINQYNQGVSAARNKGVECARYEYIAFLDADDEWLPGYLQKMREAIELFPSAGMYGCPSWHRNIMTGQAGNAILNRYKDKIQTIEYFENPQTMPHISATVVAKSIFNQIDNGNGFPVGKKLCEDWSCFNRLAFLAPYVYVGYSLAIRNNGVDGQITGLARTEQIKMMQYVVDFFNLTHEFSLNYPEKQRLFTIFFKYDVRNRILCQLRDNDHSTLQFLLSKLNPACLNEFSAFELKLYRIQNLNILAKIYIYITKLVWRSHGFPIVGRN
ncbi:glycosyltransferase family 2 protein [Methylomonas sp. AM2-LC]|uniref:glycosyltransferase family 2 protein n=1 Tax=Methylomonas sp. AM2-LC TaxID=3153301 RepID=UPI0032667FA6